MNNSWQSKIICWFTWWLLFWKVHCVIKLHKNICQVKWSGVLGEKTQLFFFFAVKISHGFFKSCSKCRKKVLLCGTALWIAKSLASLTHLKLISEVPSNICETAHASKLPQKSSNVPPRTHCIKGVFYTMDSCFLFKFISKHNESGSSLHHF